MAIKAFTSSAPKDSLQHRYEQLHHEKSSLLTRCEQYAKWTLPHVFPETGQNQATELPKVLDGLGARAVNHMANKAVTTLFRPQGSFFRMWPGKKNEQQLDAISQDENKADVAAVKAQIDNALNDAEQEAMEELDMVSFRPAATNAAKLLIITGNALEYHPEGGAVQVFNLRNYCVVRDISGAVIEIMTMECKAFETFSNAIQDKLRQLRQQDKPYEDRTEVKIYTRIKLEEDGKFHVTQAADLLDISKPDVTYPRDKLPWIVLTWNLVNGEDYGRGLVEDYAGAFHALEVLNQSLLNIAALMGDIKIFVKPTSLVDVEAVNNSPSGSYHAGNPEDIGTGQFNKHAEAQFIATMVERYEKQIAQAFLLNSSMIRDAERVTTEEIRLIANELDTSHGGVYSRLAYQWQMPLAYIILDHTKFPFASFGVKIKIITGMDSLSRQGELENIRMFIGDLTLLEAVPEDIRAGINPLKFMAFVGEQRQVEYAKFLYTQAEMQANQQRAIEQQAQLEATKAAGSVAVKAGEAAVEQENT